MKTRSPLFWTTFAAGCVAGLLVSALFRPEFVVAKPSVTDGQKFEELHERLLKVERKTSPFGVDEAGILSVNAPTEFKKPSKTVELLVTTRPGAAATDLAFKVVGPAEFENGPTRFTGDSGSEPMIIVDPVMLHPTRPEVLIKAPVAIKAPLHRPLLELTALEGVITPIDDVPPALSVDTQAILFPVFNRAIQTVGGDVDFYDGQVRIGVSDTFPADTAPLLIETPLSITMPLEIVNPEGGVRIKRNGIELLVRDTPDGELQTVSEWFSDSDSGLSFFDVDQASAYEFKVFEDLGGGDPGYVEP